MVLAFTMIEAVLNLSDAKYLGTPNWRPVAYHYGGFWAGLLHGWEPLYPAQRFSMFVSYAFLHAGWYHLLGNVLCLTWLGLQLERVYCAARFALLFAISALGGGIGFGLLATSSRPMVGASGAIMGLIAIWIGLEARMMSDEGASRGRTLAMVATRVILLAALNLAAWFTETGGLAWETHLGGFLAAGLAMLLIPALRPGR
ncbi:rhomboid family intramembrane serine protease [Salipiger sp.]|uniref:rhomboid family intramembrane serine protease n=1 Tax=Salipiger sp. TaxID=2078585 RepID=UPI003A96F873